MTQPQVALSHAIDDSERMRTDALRVARAEAARLTLALHALRHDRFAVTDEYIDRAVTALTALTTRLSV